MRILDKKMNLNGINLNGTMMLMMIWLKMILFFINKA